MQSGKKAYSDADALRWALQTAEALEYLHTRNPKVRHWGWVCLRGGAPGGCACEGQITRRSVLSGPEAHASLCIWCNACCQQHGLWVLQGAIPGDKR